MNPVRPAQFSDIKAVVAFLLKFNQEWGNPGVSVDKKELEKTMQQVVNMRWQRLFISTVHGEISGVLAGITNKIYYSRQKQVLDLVFCVDPNYKGHGYYLARRYLAWARNLKGIAPGEIYLGVTSGLEVDKTSEFYEKLGLERIGAVYRIGVKNVESSEIIDESYQENRKSA